MAKLANRFGRFFGLGCVGFGRADGRNEAIALTRHSLDINRRIRLIAERHANLPNAEIQPLIKLNEIVAPDMLLYLPTLHQLTGTVNQQAKHFGGLSL
jgi:hypothetical protein